MRPLTDQETEVVFTKLSKFIGEKIRLLLEREDGEYCFRLHKDRVYYCRLAMALADEKREALMRKAACIQRENLVSFGTCLGKFTHGKNFHLQITALDYIAPYALYKVWVKPAAEQTYLYGNHVLKSGLGRITEATPNNAGCVVYNMNDVPLGFGISAKSTTDCRRADPTAIVVLNQADIGEYVRKEHTLT